jgi:hypothetical protein
MKYVEQTCTSFSVRCKNTPGHLNIKIVTVAFLSTYENGPRVGNIEDIMHICVYIHEKDRHLSTVVNYYICLVTEKNNEVKNIAIDENPLFHILVKNDLNRGWRL